MMGKVPEHIRVHRELEYLRAVGTQPKKKGKKLSAKQRQEEQAKRKRVKERYQKLREVEWQHD